MKPSPLTSEQENCTLAQALRANGCQHQEERDSGRHVPPRASLPERLVKGRAGPGPTRATWQGGRESGRGIRRL